MNYNLLQGEVRYTGSNGLTTTGPFTFLEADFHYVKSAKDCIHMKHSITNLKRVRLLETNTLPTLAGLFIAFACKQAEDLVALTYGHFDYRTYGAYSTHSEKVSAVIEKMLTDVDEVVSEDTLGELMVEHFKTIRAAIVDMRYEFKLAGFVETVEPDTSRWGRW